MIAGLLVLALLVGREILRATDPDAPAARAVGRLLGPVAVGFALVLTVRIVDVVVGRA